MREGRLSDAIRYFDEPETKQAARAYRRAIRMAKVAWWPVDRASALFRAAQIAREHGVDIMGYEASPDYAALGGDDGHRPDENYGVGQIALEGSLVSDGEHERFTASAAKPKRRWHYRHVAVDHIKAAADSLPPRSQAFAAVLCMGTYWMLRTNAPGAEADARSLYARYLREGAYVRWGKDFGQRCPEPEFDRANWLVVKQWLNGRAAFRSDRQ